MPKKHTIRQKVEGLTVEDYSLSGKVFKMLSPNGWRHHFYDSNKYSLKKGIEDRLKELDEVKNKPENLRMLVKEELQLAIKTEKSVRDLFRRCCAGEDPHKIISNKELAKLHIWGPFAEYQAYSELLYSEKYEIDAAGGVQKYKQNGFVETIREGLIKNHKNGTEKARIMKLMISTCADPTFDEWDWLLDQVKHGHVAVMSKAKARFSHQSFVFITGAGFNHPLLHENRPRASSDINSDMSTSIVAKIWPNGLMARTTSRFYLLPNGVDIGSRINEVLRVADDDKRFDETIKLLKMYEATGANFGDAESEEYHDMATVLEKLWQEHVEASSALSDLELLHKEISTN